MRRPSVSNLKLNKGKNEKLAAKPKTEQIETFLEIVRQGSIAAASEHLALTQPAVSRRLAELEGVLGVRLMERTRSGITLTVEGETFLKYASASSSALDQGLAQMARSRRDGREAVNIGCLPNVAARVLPAAIGSFKKQNSNVPVRIVTGTNRSLTQLLRQGDLDFMVGRLASPADMSGLLFEPLYHEELVAVVRPEHPLLQTNNQPKVRTTISDYCVILPLPDTIIREDAEQLILAIGTSEISDFIETLSVEFGRAYVIDSDAIWITPRGTIVKEIENGFMQEINLDTSPTRGSVGITVRQGLRLSPLAHDLSSIVKKIVVNQ